MQPLPGCKDCQHLGLLLFDSDLDASKPALLAPTAALCLFWSVHPALPGVLNCWVCIRSHDAVMTADHSAFFVFDDKLVVRVDSYRYLAFTFHATKSLAYAAEQLVSAA